MNYECKICSKSFKDYNGLSRHSSRSHQISTEQCYIDYNLHGIWPLCKCGCNQQTKYSYQLKGFRDYCQGHQSRVKNNWGHNQSAIDKSSETRRQQYASGERKVWCDGLTKETSSIIAEYSKKISLDLDRSKKISNSLTGKSKSIEHIEKITADRKKYPFGG